LLYFIFFATNRVMRILLLGKTGLLGSEFFDIFSVRNDIELFAPTHRELDLLNVAEVDALLAGNSFDRIINCVGYTQVDLAETEKGRCKQLNVKVMETLLAHRQPIIHFSTDYVFNTSSDVAIHEDSERAPLNYYGETKVQAEKLLEQYKGKWWNIRTSWLFGNGRNFISTILDKAKTEPSLRVVSDEIGRPTSTRDLAKYIIEEFVDKTIKNGHYHVQNTGEFCSWAELAEYVLKRTGSETEVKKILADAINRPAVRPKNSFLANTKLSHQMRPWKESVDAFLGRD
jgi:dTDP-4-dehydrorhamnose reductase